MVTFFGGCFLLFSLPAKGDMQIMKDAYFYHTSRGCSFAHNAFSPFRTRWHPLRQLANRLSNSACRSGESCDRLAHACFPYFKVVENDQERLSRNAGFVLVIGHFETKVRIFLKRKKRKSVCYVEAVLVLARSKSMLQKLSNIVVRIASDSQRSICCVFVFLCLSDIFSC